MDLLDLLKKIKNTKNDNCMGKQIFSYFNLFEKCFKIITLYSWVYNIYTKKMYDNNSIKTRRGEMRVYY